MYVFVLGMPRSGTTLMGRMLSSLDGFCYLEEPNPIWRYRNYRRLGHEEFSPADASSDVATYILHRFDSIRQQAAASAMVEKTPANALRPGFVARVFPNAKYILLNRAKGDVLDSIRRRLVLGEDRNELHLGDSRFSRLVRARMSKALTIPLEDVGAYVPNVLSILSRGLIYPTELFWGPRFEGWQSTVELPIDDRIQIQIDRMDRKLSEFAASFEGELLQIDAELLFDDLDAARNQVEAFLGLPCGSLASGGR